LRKDGKLWAFLAAAATRRSELLSPTTVDSAGLATWAKRLVEDSFREECWTESWRRHALPAELATLAVLHRNSKIKHGDTLILILGESNRTDGFILKAILEYLTRSEGPLAGVGVKTVGPFKLDPQEDTTFNRNFQGFTETLGIDANVRFVLTGGYKALLIAVARWLERERSAVSIYSLHESGREVIRFGCDDVGNTGSVCVIPDVGTVC